MLNTDSFEQALYEDGKRAFGKIIEEKGDYRKSLMEKIRKAMSWV